MWFVDNENNVEDDQPSSLKPVCEEFKMSEFGAT